MTAWYYSDNQRNRLGPVAAADLAELHRHGQLQPGTLIWREGLSAWAPWHQLMDEVLGPRLPAGAPAPALAMAAASAADDRHSPFAVPDDEPARAVAGGYNPYQVVDRVAVAPAHASPYAAPHAALDGAAMAVMGGEVVYAGFWKRVAAYAIDSLVIGIPAFLLQMLIGAVVFGGMAALRSNPGEAFGTVAGILGILVMYLAPLALGATYYGLMHASSHQATLGKMAVGIKVTDEAGQPISFWRGFGRYFGLILSSLPIGIGLIMAGFTDRKRALHDMICSTLVVDRWAFTAHPERQRRELGAVTVVVMCLVGLLVLAYIALIVFMVSMAASASR